MVHQNNLPVVAAIGLQINCVNATVYMEMINRE